MTATGALAHRGTIFLEDAPVISHEAWPQGQYLLRLQAQECARRARPGSFAHLRCAPDLPMRRPLSIQRADPEAGWIELLYKAIGHGLKRLALAKPGDVISCLGPIGNGFSVHPERPQRLLLGGGVGIPPMIFLAESLLGERSGAPKPLVLMGSEIPFPFRAATLDRDW